MTVRLKQAWDRTNNVKLAEGQATLKDDDPIHVAIKARAIKDIREGNFENVGNLQVVTGAFTQEDNSPVVVGRATMCEFKSKSGTFTFKSDDPMSEKMLDNPDYTLVKSYSVEIKG
tara:strand:- start:104 stop:451 length:348 start_codon:yes stop_codon:yes gene_type:complete